MDRLSDTTLANALACAEAGADFLVSSAPCLAPPKGVQLRIAAATPVGNATKPTAGPGPRARPGNPMKSSA